MHSTFFKYLQSKFDLSKEIISFVRMNSIVKKVPKGHFLLLEGDISRNHIFVSKGTLRLYRVDDWGCQHILKFSGENSWSGNSESLFTGIASNYSIDALEDAEVLLFSRDCFRELMDKSKDFSLFASKIFESDCIVSHKYISAKTSIYGKVEKMDCLNTSSGNLDCISQEKTEVKLSVDAWLLSNRRMNTILGNMTDKELYSAVASGRNRGIYLLGHLTAFSDSLLLSLGFRDRLFPEFDFLFVNNPDNVYQEYPSADELKSNWRTVNYSLLNFIEGMSEKQWMERLGGVSGQEFLGNSLQNKLNILIQCTNHQNYHLGQLAFLL